MLVILMAEMWIVRIGSCQEERTRSLGGQGVNFLGVQKN
jgi:hypothetical protein